MIYAILDEKSPSAKTYLKKVFAVLKNQQLNYNWLVTNIECYPQNETIRGLLDHEYCWLTGQELTDIANQEDFQWAWAVFSGFDPSVPLEEAVRFPLPYADGYEGFWQPPPAIQHPLAQIELVAWDGSLTLCFSKDKEIAELFRQIDPSCEDLTEYNRKS